MSPHWICYSNFLRNYSIQRLLTNDFELWPDTNIHTWDLGIVPNWDSIKLQISGTNGAAFSVFRIVENGEVVFDLVARKGCETVWLDGEPHNTVGGCYRKTVFEEETFKRNINLPHAGDEELEFFDMKWYRNWDAHPESLKKHLEHWTYNYYFKYWNSIAGEVAYESSKGFWSYTASLSKTKAAFCSIRFKSATLEATEDYLTSLYLGVTTSLRGNLFRKHILNVFRSGIYINYIIYI